MVDIFFEMIFRNEWRVIICDKKGRPIQNEASLEKKCKKL